MAVEFDLNNTIGAAFLGNIFAAVLYGVTCLQIFIYFKNSGKDTLPFKLVICFLWILDSLQLGLVTHGLYNYLIDNFTNLFALVTIDWCILVQIYVAVTSDFIVRIIYGRRVWIITKHKWPLVMVIGLTSLAALGGGIAFTTKAFSEGVFAKLPDISYLLYFSLGCGVIADITVAVTLCISLARSRTGFEKMDTVLNKLMRYIINSSLLTTLCSVLCFITYAVWPTKFVFIAFYFCLSKLFLNSLLAMLNGRSALREHSRVLSSDLPSISQGSQASQQPLSSFQGETFASKQVKAFEEMRPLGRVKINVERRIEVEKAV